MFVRDCMTAQPTTVEPETSIDEAFDLMRSLKIRHLPVLDRGRLVGIVSYTDLLRSRSSATSLPGWEIRGLAQNGLALDIMTRDVITVSSDLPVEQAAWILRCHKIGALPVVERDMLVGIITESDLFDVLLFLLGGDIAGVRLSVDCPGGLRDLIRLAEQLETPEVETARLTVNLRLAGGVHRAHVRVATDTPLLLAERLAAADLTVSGVRFEPRSKPDRLLT